MNREKSTDYLEKFLRKKEILRIFGISMVVILVLFTIAGINKTK